MYKPLTISVTSLVKLFNQNVIQYVLLDLEDHAGVEQMLY